MATAADNSAARILNILRDQISQFAKRHVYARKLFGVGMNNKLPFITPAFVDLGDARHRAQQRLDRVFLEFAQLNQLLQFRRRFVFCVGAILHVVVKDFAQAGADRRKLRPRARWQFFENALQTLGHQLTRAKNICAVLEVQRHLRQAELRERSHLLHPGKSGHFDFNAVRDELFRFLGG